MSNEQLDNLPPHDRRDFFRSGILRILGPVADYLERKLPFDLTADPRRLRPPGAMVESSFLETCFRCGSCADACPADAIWLLESDDDQLRGTPTIDPNKRACVMCDDLSCMKVCPSGALKLVDRMAIRIGLAQMDHAICLRSAGEECTLCIEACPLGSTAIVVGQGGRIKVIDPHATGQGCTGCGVCQEQCPTTPRKAIRVSPYEQ